VCWIEQKQVDATHAEPGREGGHDGVSRHEVAREDGAVNVGVINARSLIVPHIGAS
jgi:hypothetical protein